MLKCFFKISSSCDNNYEIIKCGIDDVDIKSAYSKIFINISDNFNNIEEIFSEKILEKIPEDLQQELPEILYLKMKEICSNMNYKLKAGNVIPEINENTTFKNLYEKWFKNLLGLI